MNTTFEIGYVSDIKYDKLETKLFVADDATWNKMDICCVLIT